MTTFETLFQDDSLAPNHYLRLSGLNITVSKRPGSDEENRRLLTLLVREINGFNLRQIWKEEVPLEPSWDLPLVIAEDPFMQMYAEGLPLNVATFKRIYQRRNPSATKETIVGQNAEWELFHGVKSIPPGLKAKFHPTSRRKRDPLLFHYVQEDLKRIAKEEVFEKRTLLTLALLSHGASYRELEGKLLYVPSLVDRNPDTLIPYALEEHVIWEGVKTISLKPLERENLEPGIYLCQGTEIWPSQPMMLGSIFANLGTLGAATEPYAHSWRQIHKHLRTLAQKGASLPVVAGHSMGGALASQIALYSHPLISKAYAFNPPVVEERDHLLYGRLSEEAKNKLWVYANLDDFPFWRIGSKVIGRVHLLFGEKRWKYYPFKDWERLFFFPALIKAIRNFSHLVPAHQNIVPLMPSYCMVRLSDEEIHLENAERVERRDKIRFFPRVYRLVEFLLEFTRKHFPWQKRKDYLMSQLEWIEVHREDLEETFWISGSEDIREELKVLDRQKEELMKELKNFL